MVRQILNIRVLTDWKVIILAILMSATGLYVSAQELAKPDTIIVDKAAKDTIKTGKSATITPKKTERVHSPKKATIYSAVFPGLGQIYNRKYWKVPLVYIGLAGLIYSIDWNNDYYVQYRQAYIDISDNDPTSNSFKDLDIEGNWDFNDPSQLEQFKTRLENAKEQTRRYRDLCIIGTAAFYAINIIDASVDAHLFNFDISDDLTMNWMPQPMYAMDQPLIGIHFVVNF